MNLRLLDTDHMTILRRGGANALNLQMRLDALPYEEVVTCIVVYEEQMRGWMAEIARMQTGTRFVAPYDSLATTLEIYCAMTVLPFDDRAAQIFDNINVSPCVSEPKTSKSPPSPSHTTPPFSPAIPSTLPKSQTSNIKIGRSKAEKSLPYAAHLSVS